MHRSLIVCAAHNPRFVAKAAASAADAVLLDLEDAVAPADKPAAREAAITALQTIDFGGKGVSVRINGLDTPFMYRDLIDIAERGGPRLDAIMAPKIECAADVHMLDVLLSQIELATGRPRAIALQLQIETAKGLQNVEAIAAASARIEGLHFGPGDYAASIGARTASIGGTIEDYGVLEGHSGSGPRAWHLADPWHYAHARMINAARSAGISPVDGPYADFNDIQGLDAAARRSAAMGFDGKWVIHPTQIETINAAFTPSPSELEQAQRILEALARAEREGRGAVVLEGRMIDAASIRQARMLAAKGRAARS